MGDTQSGCLCDAADHGHKSTWLCHLHISEVSARTLIYPYSFRSHLLASSISRKKMSEYVRAVQNVSTVETTVRGVPVAVLMPIAKPVRKSVFQARVLSLRATPAAPKLDVMPALQVGRKCSA